MEKQYYIKQDLMGADTATPHVYSYVYLDGDLIAGFFDLEHAELFKNLMNKKSKKTIIEKDNPTLFTTPH